MSESLRRSSRRAKKISFKVGDVVEITKGGIIAKGKLISQVESTQSNQPRWRIVYDDAAFADEELSESSLGHILTGNSDTESPTQAPAPPPAAAQSPASIAAATAARKKNRKNGRFVKTSSPEPGIPGVVTDKKAVSFPQEASDSSAMSNSKKTSAREQRTARRSRLQPELPPVPQPKKRPPPVTVVGGTTGGNKPSKRAKTGPDEEVVKVPMLTGTLYLYKGIRRRAEFVRKY